MSRKPSTVLAPSSEIPIWIVLICSCLALLMFFGWIVKDLSVPVSPDETRSVLVQPLFEVGSKDDSANTLELVDSQTINRAPLGNKIPLKGDLKGDRKTTEPKDSPVSARASTAQSTQMIAAKTSVGTGNSEQPGTGQERQVVRQKDAQRTGNQQHADELPASERNNQRGVAEAEAEGQNTAHADAPQPETTQAKGVVSPVNPTVQAIKDPLALEGPSDTTPSQNQSPSADLGALRQLLAEAAAISKSDDEQVDAEHDELESISKLSAAIQFAPGSKVANESVTTTLNQIQQILADYPETTVNVIVATNESGNQRQDLLLSQERGRTLIARLVNSGLAFSRFSLKALSDDQLPANTHRVELQVLSKS